MSTTVKIESELFKTIEEIAKKENTTINNVIKQGIEKIKNKNKIPDYLIGNKDTYNPDPKENLKMAGIGKYGKSFSAVKLVREMREGGHDIP